MNYYFFIRIFSLIFMIIGSFLVTFSVWATYARYCSLYHALLEVNPSFADYFSPQYYNCDSTEWSEWSLCKKTQTTSKRFRTNSACKIIEDSKPCQCHIEHLCHDITLRVNSQLDYDCISSFLNFTEPFLIRGSNVSSRLLCSLYNT